MWGRLQHSASRRNARRWVVPALSSGCALVSVAAGAWALTVDQAREQCRESVGKPSVKSCVQGGGDREVCRTRAKPAVQSCMKKALDAANGRANVAVAVPAEEKAAVGAPAADGVAASFVPPPRTITDITAILDSERPDPAKLAALKAAADAPSPATASAEQRARFFHDRGNTRAQLGRIQDAIADAKAALDAARGLDWRLVGRLQQFAGLQYSSAGQPRQALNILSETLRQRSNNLTSGTGYHFNANRQVIQILLQMGDVTQADSYLRRNLSLIQEMRTSGLPGVRKNYAERGQSWESDVEQSRALMFEARGRFRDAEAAYRLAERRRRAAIKGILAGDNPPPLQQLLHACDLLVVHQARMKARQGRLAEAEADARRALLARLQEQGKYHPQTPSFVKGLADILVEQGRYWEAEQLIRATLDIYRVIGMAPDSGPVAYALASLGAILMQQGRAKEAAATYADLERVVANWAPAQREILNLDGTRIAALYATGEIEAGLAAAQALLKREAARMGEAHALTAAARGILGVGYAAAKRDADAIREFKAAVPVLVAAARENVDDDDPTVTIARSARLQGIVEAYIATLVRAGGPDVGPETFRLADLVRGRAVQQALVAAGARATVADPALASLVRLEQDLTKQVNAQLGQLNNVLGLPAAEREEQGVAGIQAAIARDRAERDKTRVEIGRRFPSYADLIDPKPPSIPQLREALAPGEALLSFYFGREASFVWAIPKDGAVGFAQIAATTGDVEEKVGRLRKALEPDAQFVSDIPAFDVGLSHELYALLLKPVEEAWRPAKSLIVVSNGAVGLLPMSLLATEPAEVSDGDAGTFAGYRRVRWLARTHAVSNIPSAAALRTLRNLPPASGGRDPLIGFGDALFAPEPETPVAVEAKEPERMVTAFLGRGVPFRRRSGPSTSASGSAGLADLPRLPDTADELRAIAVALNADPAKVIKLQKDANERVVKSTDLSRFKIVAFATHGLVPGEINGLTQPALALTAPAIADVDGDGLLTMEEVLSLKLDADWVVLSACNTGAGAGAGAEAASGLGRAFFYAGTRSLLLTNWSVHSASARDLVADLFQRQAADAQLRRSEALRQAMVALMDGPGYLEEGRALFTYAHPLFWAPYSIIGDGGS